MCVGVSVEIACLAFDLQNAGTKQSLVLDPQKLFVVFCVNMHNNFKYSLCVFGGAIYMMNVGLHASATDRACANSSSSAFGTSAMHAAPGKHASTSSRRRAKKKMSRWAARDGAATEREKEAQSYMKHVGLGPHCA
jgi:hypothetical protein